MQQLLPYLILFQFLFLGCGFNRTFLLKNHNFIQFPTYDDLGLPANLKMEQAKRSNQPTVLFNFNYHLGNRSQIFFSLKPNERRNSSQGVILKNSFCGQSSGATAVALPHSLPISLPWMRFPPHVSPQKSQFHTISNK